MSIRARIVGGFLALILLQVLLASYHLRLVGRLREDVRSLADVDLAATTIALEAFGRLAQQRDLSERFALLRDARYSQRLAEGRADLAAELARLRPVAPTAEVAERIADLEARWRKHSESARELEDAIERRAPAAEYLEDGRALFDRFHETLDEAMAAARLQTTTRIEQTEERSRRALVVAWTVTAAALALAVVLAIALSRSISRPLADLAAGARALTLGDFERRVMPAGAPELEQLALDFNQMAARLGELDQLKRDFVTGVSHDLKSPLASIHDTIDLLLDGSVGELNEKQARLLSLVRQSSGRLRTMVTTLLDLARVDAGTFAFEPRTLSLDRVIDTALEDLRAAPDADELPIERRQAESSRVIGDSAQLLQVITNLLQNALQHSPPGGTITIETRLCDRGPLPAPGWVAGVVPSTPAVLCEIGDQGQGIEDSEKARVFDRFYRGKKSPRRQGSGLGLAIAAAIVRHHHGALWVEDAEGGGSRFVLALPASAEALAP